jgi:hypothetical protein
MANFATELMGWRRTRNRLVPNMADVDSDQSCEIAGAMLDALGVERGGESEVPASPGRPLEVAVTRYVKEGLQGAAPEKGWAVDHGSHQITDFFQYQHLLDIDALVVAHPELRMAIGRGYLIKPDVCVGLSGQGDTDHLLFLHAAISCKWTIRSDRVQNIRHENNQMIRHRRGRLPHLVSVTAEPLPSRLIAIARGTGEVDAVYHIALGALVEAVEAVGNDLQKELLDECILQRRLLPFSDLVPTLLSW